MITVTTTQARPSVDIPFYMETQPLVADSFRTLLNTTVNFAMQPTFSLSVDWLVHTSIATYDSHEQYEAFIQELNFTLPGFFAARNAYCEEHGIWIDRTVT
jgi:hypothetical protein